MDELLGSLTINADPARQSLDLLGRDLDAVGTKFDRTADKFVKETQEIVQETRRLSEVSREWKRYEENIAGSQAAMERFARLTGEADRALAAGRINIEAHAKAVDTLRARFVTGAADASKMTGEIEKQAAAFGRLNATDITQARSNLINMSQQVLATGNATQALTVQGPELLGLFTKLPGTVMAATAGFVGMAGAAAVVAARVSEISSESRRLDTTLRALNPTLDANSSSLRKMAFDVANDTGATRRDVTGIIEQVIRNRQINNAELVKGISALSVDMGSVLGDDPAKIGDRLAGAFAKGAAGIRELDRELGFLSPETARLVRDLDEAGKRSQAMGVAMDALKGRFGGAARDMESEWGKSVKAMRTAWDDFLEQVGKSDFANGAARVGAKVLQGWTQWITPSDPEEEKMKKMLKDYLELDEMVKRKAGQLQDAFEHGQSGPGVGLLHKQLEELQRQFFEVAKAIEEAKRAKDRFTGSGGVGGVTPPPGTFVPPPPPRKPSIVSGGLSDDERKRIDELQHALDKESEALRSNSVERQIRIAGLSAETGAIEAGRSAEAAKAERMVAERRELVQLAAAHADGLDTLRREVEWQEKIAGAARDGVPARMAAERAAQSALQTSDMLRAAHAAEARGESDLAGQVRDLAGAYDDLSRRGADAAKLNSLNTMVADTRTALRAAQADGATIGMGEVERARIMAQIKAEDDLLKAGVDLQADLSPEIRASATEYLRSVDILTQTNAQVERQQKAWDALTGSLEHAFDRVGDSMVDAFVRGEGAGVNFRNAMKGALTSIGADLLKMSVLNPVKNMLFGTNSPTIDDLFGGAQNTTKPIGAKSMMFNRLTVKGRQKEGAQ